MTNERQQFIAALSEYDEGDLGGIADAARQNGFLDKVAEKAGEFYEQVVDPLVAKPTKKEPAEPPPTPWLLYGTVVVGLVGAGALVWYFWPKKKGGGE